jgi:hypothetical protein
MSDRGEQAALARVPDIPQWMDTRGMLVTGRATVSFPPDPDFAADGFVVELASRALLSALDNPPPALIADRALAMAGDVNLLCAPDTAAVVARALPTWISQPVRLQALPARMAWEARPDDEVSIFTLADAPNLEDVPLTLRRELTDALEGHPVGRFVPGTLPPRSPADAAPTPTPIAAAWADGRPAAFCYPVLQTESLWDVSVETLVEYRGRGLAGRAARAMIRHMRGRGKAPVWGALESNVASLSVARQLGFVDAGRLAVFTPR